MKKQLVLTLFIIALTHSAIIVSHTLQPSTVPNYNTINNYITTYLPTNINYNQPSSTNSGNNLDQHVTQTIGQLLGQYSKLFNQY